MKSSELLDENQLEAIEFLYTNDYNYLVATMGAGKSVICLSAMVGLLAAELNTRFLILAPKKVVNSVWATEHEEWTDLAHLRVGILTENQVERQRIFNNIEDYDVIAANYEMMPWLVENNRLKCFDGLAIDEGSKIGAGGKYFKLMRRHLKGFSWRTVMTGTPVSENHVKLFYQMYAVGDGVIFGRNKDKWLTKYFYPTDIARRNFELRPDRADEFIKRVAAYTHVMPDYRKSLPPLVVQPVFVDLPDGSRQVYNDMAKKLYALGVEAATMATRMGKLQQIASGALYDDDEVIDLHDLKLDVVRRITRDETRTHLIAYQFEYQVEQLERAFPDLVVMPGDSAGVAKTVADWNAGLIRRLAVHSRSSGHGLNLAQGGCSVIWMTPTFSNDQFEQLNCRLWRRGQQKPVTVILILAKDTVEDQVIVPRLEKKQEIMPLFLAHLDSIVAGERDEPARERKAYPH